MATAAQVRGMLLEEVLLFLLAASGYRTVELDDIEDDDPLLHRGPAGIDLWGRGAKHQIDVPNRHVDLSQLDDLHNVRIRWQGQNWFIDLVEEESQLREKWPNVDNPHRLFSFNLPEALFAEYARHDLLSGRSRLTHRDALQLKEEALSEIQATIVTDSGQFRVLTMHLDPYWLNELEERLRADDNFRGE